MIKETRPVLPIKLLLMCCHQGKKRKQTNKQTKNKQTNKNKIKQTEKKHHSLYFSRNVGKTQRTLLKQKPTEKLTL